MRTQPSIPLCPLCSGKGARLFFKDKNRTYLRCLNCCLIFVPPYQWLSFGDEKAVYDLHENDVQDPGYRKFLSRLSVPLLKVMGNKKVGLDFGCGPGPALSVMMEESGHTVDLYDPFYHKDVSVFDKTYDFITATEVVEHLRNPKKEFLALFSMLKQGAWLGIMTKMVTDLKAFTTWHYIRDDTHICFYSRATFEFIAHQYDATVIFENRDVILFQKKIIP